MGKVIDFLNSENRSQELKDLQNSIECFTSNELAEYLNRLKEYVEYGNSFKREKNFYDAVWGTIVISESEVEILNSPLLQRLRDIKQLGLANLLYSCADHSRFSHTIGVLNVSSQICSQVQKELKKKGCSIDETEEQIVRLAAIFHDVGHMFCSHASERYFQDNVKSSLFKKVFKIRKEFEKKLGKEPPLSEILSVLIVNSSAVKELLGVVSKGLIHFKFSNEKERRETLERISCLILGIPYSKKSLPYSQIISGSIDADKLDYLKRDSHMTGVPVAVDMSRIFQKLRVVHPSKPVKDIVETSENENQPEYVMGIAPAAINTVDQLCVSRFNMYENIYYHQKVLTAEEMLRYAVELIDKGTKGIFDNFAVIMELTDSAIITKDFRVSMEIIKQKGRNFQIVDEALLNRGCLVLAHIKNRNLFKRCLSINQEYLTGITKVVDDFYQPIFVDKDINKKDEFLDRIICEIKNIKRILVSAEQSGVFFNGDTDALILYTPDAGESVKGSNITIADRKSRNRDEIFLAGRWLMSRTTRKTQNYLITYEEDRFIGFIAVEKVLYRDYGIRAIDMDLFDRDDDREIDRIKNYLKNKGYYKDAYVLVPDTSVRLRSDSINYLVDRWKSYLRFDLEDAERKPIDFTFLSSFIMQFYRFEPELKDFDVFVEGCIEMLMDIRLINKNDILTALKTNIDNIINERNIAKEELTICNLGTVQDGSAQVSYQINEINAFYKDTYKGYKVENLESISPDKIKGPILFLEDAFSSARQIVSIFEEYMGVPLKDRKTKENHAKELTTEMKEKIKNTDLYFSFIFYNQDNKEFFYDNMKKLGLEKIHILSKEKFPNGYFKDTDKCGSSDKKSITRQYFEKAGRILIDEKAHLESGERKEGWDDERMAKSILGYEDAQQLIVFPWNTPTYTITALWMSSKKFNWIPLFQRIDK